MDHPNPMEDFMESFANFSPISFSVFLVLLDILKRRWYPTWRESHTCAAGKPAAIHCTVHSISVAIQYTLLLVSNTTVVQWPCTVFGYTGRLVTIQ